MKRTFVLAAGIFALALSACGQPKKAPEKIISPQRGSISVQLRLNGSVNPRNRLEIKPQVAGRLDDVLVVEGQRVKKGDILAWISSSDRAALLDAARAQGPDELKKWEDVYKPAPLVAPLDGFIIDRSKEPGQTVGTADPVLVMADKLIVQADVDETDLRYVKLGQKVKVMLDAWPDRDFTGTVEHIAYESQVLNNVTVYEVKIRPENPPEGFLAGMTATIEITSEKKDNALLLPADAVSGSGPDKFVKIALSAEQGAKFEKRKIVTGITNARQVEIISGLEDADKVIVPDNRLDSNNRMRGPGSMFGIGTKK